MAAELRKTFVQIHGAINIRILFLNLFATATQRNDLAVLSKGKCNSPPGPASMSEIALLFSINVASCVRPFRCSKS